MVAIDAAQRELTIAHQAIPGVMEAMTMPYIVSKEDSWVFGKIAPGDHIHATLVITDHAELHDINFTRATDDNGAASPIHIPQPGDPVPDITLTNQNGKTIRFQQLRGKPLLLTFIYTRCPFPDFCPRLSSNFQQVLEQLQKNPKALERAQLLSISIDPEHDTPAILRSYGERYVGRLDPKFQHWQFASGSPQQVRQAADFFGLAYNQKDGQLVHGLTTVLIGRDGKVLKVYSGNAWRPEEVASDVAAAASAE